MKLHQQIQVAAELIGARLSDVAVAAMAKKLSSYPAADVTKALDRCSEECRSLRLVDVLERLPSGHPSGDEAWALCANVLVDEGATVVWTDAIAEAFGVACELSNDRFAARKAFMAAYERALSGQRTSPPRWWDSRGHDRSAWEGAVRQAVSEGKLKAENYPEVPMLPVGAAAALPAGITVQLPSVDDDRRADA